jgi:hypothetical protein
VPLDTITEANALGITLNLTLMMNQDEDEWEVFA